MKKRELSRVVYTKEAQQRIMGNLCAACGKPKKDWKRRKDWKCCSKTCSNAFYASMLVATSWADLRAKTIQRDEYTCNLCGAKPTKQDVTFKDDNPCKVTVGDASQLVADHITPIALGGEQWEPTNIQTLCKLCNKAKTRTDIEAIAKERRKYASPEQLSKMLQEALAKGEVDGT